MGLPEGSWSISVDYASGDASLEETTSGQKVKQKVAVWPADTTHGPGGWLSLFEDGGGMIELTSGNQGASLRFWHEQ